MALSAYKKHKIKRQLANVLIIFGVLIVVTITLNYGVNYLLAENKLASSVCGEGNVALIKVHGEIVTYRDSLADERDVVSSEEIVEYINSASEDGNVKAIVLDVDSYGGSPVAGKEIADALRAVGKPTVALIRGAGDSAGYMLATGAQKIYATDFSEVGSIGITMSYLDYSQKNIAEGVAYQEISSGKFKDIGNPNKSITQEEYDMLAGFVRQLKDNFVSLISENRNMDRAKVEEVADGSIMTAQEAKNRGLIDEIGDLEDVKFWLKTQLGTDLQVCPID